MVRWACSALSLSVWTTMPSVTCVLQAIWSLGIFSISTRHMRQLPSMGRSGWQQKCGISIPICAAAWMTVVPLRDLDGLAVDRGAHLVRLGRRAGGGAGAAGFVSLIGPARPR